jgi:hypothetical protein
MVSRSGRVWGLIADQARLRGGRVSAADACAAAVAAVEVTGAWLSAARNAEAGYLIAATNGVSERLAELALTLGEGPTQDAAIVGAPVLASDLAAAEYGWRWPAFAQAALAAGPMAIFVFPLRIGAIRAGVLGMYRDKPGSLSAIQLGDALTVAEIATLLLLGVDGDGHNGTGPGGQPPDLARHRAEIDQATGMLTEQLSTSIDDAFVRLRAYACSRDLPLIDVARDIVARRLRLYPSVGSSLDGDT